MKTIQALKRLSLGHLLSFGTLTPLLFGCHRRASNTESPAKPVATEVLSSPVLSSSPKETILADVPRLEIVNDRVVWMAVGSQLFGTEDGGVHWSERTPTNAEITGTTLFHAASGKVVVAVAKDVVRTADGGAHWTTVAAGAGRPCGQSWRGERGWIAWYDETDGATVMATVDGGATWSHPRVPVFFKDGECSLASPDEKSVFVLFSRNLVSAAPHQWSFFVSVDAGMTWTERIAPEVSELWFRDALHGFAVPPRVGDVSLSITKDGGKSWKTLPSVEGLGLPNFAPDFGSTVLSKVGTALTGFGVSYTSDDGVTWTVASPPSGNEDSVKFIRGMNAWILDVDSLGKDKTSLGALHHTRDGVHWTSALTKSSGKGWRVFEFLFVNAYTGWATARRAAPGGGEKPQWGLLVTNDGGTTWASIGKLE